MKTLYITNEKERLDFIQEAQKFFFAEEYPTVEKYRRINQNVFYREGSGLLAIRDKNDSKAFMLVEKVNFDDDVSIVQ